MAQTDRVFRPSMTPHPTTPRLPVHLERKDTMCSDVLDSSYLVNNIISNLQLPPKNARPKRTQTLLLNINLLDIHKLAIHLRHSHSQNTILQLRRDALNIHMSRVRAASQPDHPLESANLALVKRQTLEELLVAGSVNHPSDVDLGFLGVPVDSDVFLFGAGQAEVDHVRIVGVEDVGIGGEVFGLGGQGGVVGVVVVGVGVVGATEEAFVEHVG
jgi:hypothetical protein